MIFNLFLNKNADSNDPYEITINMVRSTFDLRVVYTQFCHYARCGYITKDEHIYYTEKALLHMNRILATIRVQRKNEISIQQQKAINDDFECILVKAVQDKLITKHSKQNYLCHVIKDIYEDICILSSEIDSLTLKVKDISSALAKMREYTEKKQQIETFFGMIGAFLSIVPGGPIISQSIKQIVDFGDSIHIQSIMTALDDHGVAEMSFVEALEAGMQFLETKTCKYIDSKMDSIIDDLNNFSKNQEGLNDEQKRLRVIGASLQAAMTHVSRTKLEKETSKDAIINEMNVHNRVSSVQETGCKKLSQIMKSRTTPSLGKSDGQAIVTAMRDFPENSEIQIYGIDILTHLNSIDICNGDILISMKNYPSNVHVQKSACLAFASLNCMSNSVYYSQNKYYTRQVIKNHGGIKEVIQALKKNDDYINTLHENEGNRYKALLSLAKIDSNSYKYIEKFIGIDAIVLDLLQNGESNLSLQKHASLLLIHMARHNPKLYHNRYKKGNTLHDDIVNRVATTTMTGTRVLAPILQEFDANTGDNVFNLNTNNMKPLLQFLRRSNNDNCLQDLKNLYRWLRKDSKHPILCSQSNATEIVTDIMKNSNDMCVIRRGCKILNFSDCADAVSQGAVEVIVAALKKTLKDQEYEEKKRPKSVKDIDICLLQSLCNVLCESDSSANIAQTQCNNILQTVISLFNDQEKENQEAFQKKQQYILEILLYALKINPSAPLSENREDVTRVIISIMNDQKDNISIQQFGCEALCYSLKKDKNTENVTEPSNCNKREGIIATISNAIKNHGDDDFDVQRYGFLALACLDGQGQQSSLPITKGDIIVSNVFPLLVGAAGSVCLIVSAYIFLHHHKVEPLPPSKQSMSLKFSLLWPHFVSQSFL